MSGLSVEGVGELEDQRGAKLGVGELEDQWTN